MPKHTIELFNLPTPQDGKTIGYRITGGSSVHITDADYLLHSLAETLSYIGLEMPEKPAEGAYPWPQ